MVGTLSLIVYLTMFVVYAMSSPRWSPLAGLCGLGLILLLSAL